MKRILRYISAWYRFRMMYYLPFLRPAHVVFNGSMQFDCWSFIHIDKHSSVCIENGCSLKKSRIYIEDSHVQWSAAACFNSSVMTVRQSRLNAGSYFKCNAVQVGLYENTEFVCGEYALLDGSRHERSGFSAFTSKIKWKNNVTHYAHTVCQNGNFTVGENVFFNQGTQMRCQAGLHFGSNILVSYECVIFDTNTHSLTAADRRKEIMNGYPNKSFQMIEDREKVKKAPIEIGDDVWIGTRAMIFKGTVLEDEVVVGAAAVVSGLHAPKGSKVIGNPGKVIG